REAHDTLGEASLAKVCPGGNFKLGERRLRAVYKHIGQVAIPQKPALGKDAGHWQRGIVWSLGAIVGALAISIAMSALFLSMGEPRGGAGLRTVFAPKEQTEREAANDSEMPLDEGGAPTTNAPVVESGKRISKAQSSNGPSV